MTGRRRNRAGTITVERGRFRARGPLRDDGTREALGTFDTRADAKRAIAAAELLDADRPIGTTLAVWGERWLAKRDVRGLRKERSAWRRHVATHPIADRLVRRITRADVETWIRDVQKTDATRARVFGPKGEAHTVERVPLGRTVSRQTAQHALRILRACLDAAVVEGLAQTNAAADVRLRREGTAHHASHELEDGTEIGWAWMTGPEIERLLAVAPRRQTKRAREHLERCRAIWTVAIFTGLRAGELWGLRWCDVRLDGEHPAIQVRRSYKGPPKTARAVRDVPLLPVAVEALRAWQRTSGAIGDALVFPADAAAQTCHAEGYDAGLAIYLPIAGITRPGISVRALRHTCASHLIQGSWTTRPLRLEEAQRWLGHSSITVTQRYAHLAPGSLRDLIRRETGRVLAALPLTTRKR